MLSQQLTRLAQSGIDRAVAECAVTKIAAHDPSLWSGTNLDEVSDRLGWTDSYQDSQAMLDDLSQLRQWAIERCLDRIVLCGMGGSSLAPEVICRSAGVELLVLDSSHPDTISSALRDLPHSAVVVSSKSGSTLETESQFYQFLEEFEQAGLLPSDHMVVVTDPSSALEKRARRSSIQVFHGDPRVGGRYSALTAFGLVPSALAGADVAHLLAEAAAAADLLTRSDAANPAVQLGAAIAAVSDQKLGILAIDEGDHPGLGDWIEQLVAESLGKNGKGTLPVVLRSLDAIMPADALDVRLSANSPAPESLSMAINAPLGAQFLLWEYATAIAGFLMDVNPFDQPDVELSKAAARTVLERSSGPKTPSFEDGSIRGWGTNANNVHDAIQEILRGIPAGGYLGLCWFLDRWNVDGLESLTRNIAQKISRPVTFGWGPRYLHSTGQLHKGGPPVGSFIHLSMKNADPRTVAGQSFTWSDLIESQVRGDAKVLRDLGLPVLRLEISSLDEDLPRVISALTRDAAGN